MPILFGRNYRVTITPDEGGDQIIITGNRVAFDITKTLSSEPNVGIIKVYNLSAQTRNLIKDVDYTITLEAGYGDRLDIIFKGSITDVSHAIQKPEVVTTIEGEDGGKEIKRSRISKSFSEGYSSKKMVDDIAKGLNLPFKIPTELTSIIDSKILGSEVFNGQVKNALDRIGLQSGFSWSVQNGELVFTVDYKLDSNEVAVLNYQSGLIGSPERIAIQDKKGKELKGWRVTSFLNPLIVPSNQISIESREIKKSFFKIDNCKITGDSHGKDWVVVAEVLEV